jgi:hypothetical protein
VPDCESALMAGKVSRKSPMPPVLIMRVYMLKCSA